MFFCTMQAVESATPPEKYKAGDSTVSMVLKTIKWNLKDQKKPLLEKIQAIQNSVFQNYVVSLWRFDVVFHMFKWKNQTFN